MRPRGRVKESKGKCVVDQGTSVSTLRGVEYKGRKGAVGWEKNW